MIRGSLTSTGAFRGRSVIRHAGKPSSDFDQQAPKSAKREWDGRGTTGGSRRASIRFRSAGPLAREAGEGQPAALQKGSSGFDQQVPSPAKRERDRVRVTNYVRASPGRSCAHHGMRAGAPIRPILSASIPECGQCPRMTSWYDAPMPGWNLKANPTPRSERAMSFSGEPEKRSYQSLYEEFDSSLMSRIRRQAYGEDIGQHSWVTAQDLRCDVVRLKLADDSRLLDLGCGPCGPLTFIMKSLGCFGIGLDLSAAALAAGRRRAETLGLGHRLLVQEADLDTSLSLADSSVDAVISLDVILHLRDRQRAFGDIARVLVPGGRFLFTDAGVVTGSISSDEAARRSMHGFVQFCAPGYNEKMLEGAGFALLEVQDRTRGMRENAEGRLLARAENQVDVERLEGVEGFARYQAYLRTIIETAERGALSRVMYLTEAKAH